MRENISLSLIMYDSAIGSVLRTSFGLNWIICTPTICGFNRTHTAHAIFDIQQERFVDMAITHGDDVHPLEPVS